MTAWSLVSIPPHWADRVYRHREKGSGRVEQLHLEI